MGDREVQGPRVGHRVEREVEDEDGARGGEGPGHAQDHGVQRVVRPGLGEPPEQPSGTAGYAAPRWRRRRPWPPRSRGHRGCRCARREAGSSTGRAGAPEPGWPRPVRRGPPARCPPPDRSRPPRLPGPVVPAPYPSLTCRSWNRHCRTRDPWWRPAPPSGTDRRSGRRRSRTRPRRSGRSRYPPAPRSTCGAGSDSSW